MSTFDFSENPLNPKWPDSGCSVSDRRRTVLIVEDETVVAKDVRETLSELGYAVVGTARSARSALRQIGRAHV